MSAAVVTRTRLMVVADAWDVEAHCRARETLWHFTKSPPVNSHQQEQYSRARRLIKRGLA